MAPRPIPPTRKEWFTSVTIATALAVLVLIASSYFPEKRDPDSTLFDRVSPSVVAIVVNSEFSGTGFAVNGRIYTCWHVIAAGPPQSKLTVRVINGDEQPAAFTRVNFSNDLAELIVERPPQSLTVRVSPPRVRERVWQIGNPGALRFVESRGEFAGFARIASANFFLIDTWFGNSGSPIVDYSGAVIGMTHAIYSGSRFTNAGTLADLRAFIYPDEPR